MDEEIRELRKLAYIVIGINSFLLGFLVGTIIATIAR